MEQAAGPVLPRDLDDAVLLVQCHLGARGWGSVERERGRVDMRLYFEQRNFEGNTCFFKEGDGFDFDTGQQLQW